MKIATIGTGFIVDTFLESLKTIPDVECIAMFSRKLETAAPLAQKYSIDLVYTDMDAMLANSEIDFVYVASPNSLHYEQALKALQQGKNVICEKPFTSTTKETEHLITVARENKLMLFEAITTIHLPNFLFLKQSLARLGKIRVIQCNYSQYSSRYNKLLAGETPNIFNPQFSGGALLDINIYNLHFVMNLFGYPQGVHYYANKHSNGIDTSGILILEYPEFLAECVGSKDTGSLNFAMIQGENGYLLVEEGANGCRKVIFHCGANDEIRFDEQPNPNLLYYEMKRFCEIHKQNDYAACYTILDYSLTVVSVLEKARKDAGILFPADSK
ncbi:MAG: Gfo/Idh/MocA family oxidoreductase [Chloroflexi bacterium]|nr:Gfo/Idh/MocA family oxidoreductase [Chloroflexota bacterium]